jgi:uncharacterized protein YdcH (DUF465 family)
MHPTDMSILETLSSTDAEVQRLLDRHREYEARLDALSRQRWLSDDEQREHRDLKRRKLIGRDRMALIVRAARRTPANG